jgi:hypothetical protein
MKRLTKTMLTPLLALAASFAISAQAGRPTLSSARETHGSNQSAGRIAFSAQQAGNRQQSPMEFIYMIDDGSAEDAVGLEFDGDLIALNEFAVLPGAEEITTISIAWGWPVVPDPTLDGLPYTVAIWSDPNGDGSPTDAVLLTTAGGVISLQGTDTFIVTDIPDTTITTANFFVGFLITQSAGQFPAAFDKTAPTYSDRSYVAGAAAPGSGDINDLNNNDLPVAPIEFYGQIGNWLIRAESSGTVGGGVNLLSAASRLTHGSAGDFDINMPLSGTSGVEDRASATYNAVFTFDAPVTSGDMIVVSGTATVGAITFNGNEMSAQLTGVTAAEVVTLRAENVNGSGMTGDVPFGFLTGDVNGDRIVSQPDAIQVRQDKLQAVTGYNFPEDIDLSGVIDNPDFQAVKANQRHRIR